MYETYLVVISDGALHSVGEVGHLPNDILAGIVLRLQKDVIRVLNPHGGLESRGTGEEV